MGCHFLIILFLSVRNIHDGVAYSYRRDQVEANDYSFQQFLRGMRSGNIGILSDTLVSSRSDIRIEDEVVERGIKMKTNKQV